MSSNIKTFIFAFAMCLICGVLLTATSEGLKQRQADNILLDKRKNILKSLGFIKPKGKYSRQQLTNLYDNNVKVKWISSEGKVLDTDQDGANPIFIVEKDGNIDAYAVPFSAYGLWSWVKGYISFEKDGTTVKGFTVYSHAETPGLGGECDKPWFQDQFIGKKLLNNKGEFVSIGVVKGKVVDFIKPDDYQNHVDGMSGATITGKGIEKYLKDTLAKYEPFAKELRI